MDILRLMWNEPSVSFFNGYVDTERYDVINGELVERKDYKKKRLQQELDGIEDYINRCEEGIIAKEKRKKELKKELEKLE